MVANYIKSKQNQTAQTWEGVFFWLTTREPKLPLFGILFKRFHDALETRQLFQYSDIVPARFYQPARTGVFHLLFFIEYLQTVRTSHHLNKPADRNTLRFWPVSPFLTIPPLRKKLYSFMSSFPAVSMILTHIWKLKSSLWISNKPRHVYLQRPTHRISCIIGTYAD